MKTEASGLRFTRVFRAFSLRLQLKPTDIITEYSLNSKLRRPIWQIVSAYFTNHNGLKVSQVLAGQAVM